MTSYGDPFGGAGMTGADTSRWLGRGQEKALGELGKFYEGPIQGLQIAPEFYKLLGSNAFRNTPIGKSMMLQNQLLGEVSAGLGGQGFGADRMGGRGAGTLPPDLAYSIGNNLTSQMGAAGTIGSPIGAIQAAMRFSGASEDIRAQRIAQASQILGQIGGASIMPSSSQFLGLGAERAGQAANLQYRGAQDIAQAEQQKSANFGQMFGQAKAIGENPFQGTPFAGMFGGMGFGMQGFGGRAPTQRPYGGFEGLGTTYGIGVDPFRR